ncbi:hypothetical protein CGC20_2905 [Leishmania donovani]|uniref:Uncharacterized protein n=1 Tax=Leishmania donovani TaxID=5661 RepID=A0A3Q8IF19_LEIDO|nr:hypothetical protein, unknown function [Leishmania donovani]AYU81458.1 hypothetical protein LdCL_310033200 [Leishmania donovani]TPP41371.1 hypothetical protein CGC20_2905 [Leishmania donovani]TPP42518.1 hypothetical protein CGC21_11015 [Leishmania donovani]CBZ36650.1 hypothetical protein, unknown function [Leishmania donovani]
MSKAVQFSVLKQGSLEPGSWTQRVLTIDTKSDTVTISRKHHPEHVFYHSLEVAHVQMWPRYRASEISGHFNSLKAKMTLRIFGKQVPVPKMSVEAVTAADVAEMIRVPSVPSSISLDASLNIERPPVAAATLSQKQKERHPATATSANDDLCDSWMIRFTSIDSYELAVMLLRNMRNKEGKRKRLFGDHVLQDLECVKKAWDEETKGAKSTGGALRPGS